MSGSFFLPKPETETLDPKPLKLKPWTQNFLFYPAGLLSLGNPWCPFNRHCKQARAYREPRLATVKPCIQPFVSSCWPCN
jgi:hypothetical protein